MMNLDNLPITHQATVREEYLDEMGHMNVMWYTHLFDQGTWRFFESMGMGLAYFESRDAGAFAIEQHTRYLVELLLDQSVMVRSRLLGRSAKRLHFMHFMTVAASDVLVATTELIGIHIDCATRRSSPLPDDIAASVDHVLEEHQGLSWTAPVCGVMGP